MMKLTFVVFTLAMLMALPANGIPYYSRRSQHHAINNVGKHIKKINPKSSNTSGNKRNDWNALDVDAPKDIITVNEGSRVQLECNYTGNPLPSIHWVHGENVREQARELRRQYLREPEKLFQGIAGVTSKLVYGCVTPSDQGLVTCVTISNEKPRISNPTMLIVEGENARSDFECEGIKEPVIILHTTHLFVPQDASALLLCRAEGSPAPEILWYDPSERLINDSVENNDLENEPKYVVTANGDLVIRDIRWEDMGTYRCVAKNRHGRQEATSFLYPVKNEDSDLSDNGKRHIDEDY